MSDRINLYMPEFNKSRLKLLTTMRNEASSSATVRGLVEEDIKRKEKK